MQLQNVVISGDISSYLVGPSFSYGSFGDFRECLVSLTTNGEITDFYQRPEANIGFWYEEECRKLLPEEVEDEESLLMLALNSDIDIKEVKAETEKLKVYLVDIKLKYPNLYKLLPLLCHSDCDGEIPHKLLNMVLDGLIAARDKAIEIMSKKPEYNINIGYMENYSNLVYKNPPNKAHPEFPIDGRICGFIELVETALKEDSAIEFC